jgi:predicted nucleotidyltransferase
MNNTVKEALSHLKATLAEEFGQDIEIILFGSAARGDYDKFSDVDILVLIPGEVDITCEERIFDMAFDVGLRYDIVFGIIVYSTEFWQTPRAMVMPIYENIKQEGISI